MIRWYFILLYTFFAVHLEAQFTPCFSTNDTIGCVPYTVRLKDCSGAPTSNIVYIFEENGSFDSTTSTAYTFNSEGFHSVTQLVGSNEGIKSLKKDDYIRSEIPDPPLFNLYACENFIIQVEILDNSYENYVIDYNDGNKSDTIESQQTISHQFNSIGIQKITVTGIFNNFKCSNFSTKNIQTINLLRSVEISSLVAGDNETKITFLTDSLTEYNLQRSASGVLFEKVDTVSFVTDSHTFTSETSRNSTNYYLIQAFDRCGNTIESLPYQSLFLQLNVQNNKNELHWTKYQNDTQFSNYQISKNQSTFLEKDTAFIDTLVSCGINYCYYVQVNTIPTHSNSGSSTFSRSNTICEEAFSNDTPKEPKQIESSIIDSSLNIHWSTISNPSAKNYQLYALLDNGTLSPLETFSTSDTLIILPIYNDKCYAIDYIDVCNNKSPQSEFTCPIKLEVNTIGESYLAEWTNYNREENLLYDLLIYNQKGEIISTVNDITNTTYEFSWPNKTDQTISVLIAQHTSNFTSSSNKIIMEEKSSFQMPTAFTPNDDGLNDVFRPVGKFISSYNLKIYNSLGILIFVSSDQSPAWNGKYKDEKVSIGTYYYEVSAVDKKGLKNTANGAVSVIY